MRTPTRSRPWRRRIGALLAVLALLTAACSGDDDDETADPDPDTASAEPGDTTTTTIDPALIAPLTGIVGDDAEALQRSALVVKIDNVEEARPQAGVTAADVIVEERVEADVSRLVAVFHSTIPDQVGPVRSTRSTDFDLATLFGRPVYASSGGNAGIMANFAGVDVIDVGHNRSGTGFERESGRPAPHNLMGTPADLYGRAGDEATAPPAPIFTFRDEDDELPAGAEPAQSVGLGFGGAEVSRFDWDEGEGLWIRSQRGSEHVDVDGTALSAANVVVAQITYTFGNGVGTSNPHGITTGEGPAMVFTDGHVIRGTWNRPTPADPFALVDEAGAPIALTPGRTFLELPGTGDTVSIG